MKTKIDEQKTNVQFLAETDGTILAYFPDEIADGQYNRLCYAHIGQHSACSPDYANELRTATKNEYKALFQELTSIGYNLKVID
jgi:hypothetical protein